MHHIAEKIAFLLINCKIVVTRGTEKQTLLLAGYKHATGNSLVGIAWIDLGPISDHLLKRSRLDRFQIDLKKVRTFTFSSYKGRIDLRSIYPLSVNGALQRCSSYRGVRYINGVGGFINMLLNRPLSMALKTFLCYFFEFVFIDT